jgi:hypothetical protein
MPTSMSSTLLFSAIVSVLEPDALNNAHTPETVAPETKMPEPTAMGRRLGDMLPHLGKGHESSRSTCTVDASGLICPMPPTARASPVLPGWVLA